MNRVLYFLANVFAGIVLVLLLLDPTRPSLWSSVLDSRKRANRKARNDSPTLMLMTLLN